LLLKRNFYQAQIGIARDIYLLESERMNKDGLFSLQARSVRIDKF
jgi:hypothetical protein